MSISGACHFLGLVTAAFDSAIDLDMDFMSPMGLLLAVQLLRRCKPGSVIWLGPPCSTWVFMSRSTTGRRASTPLGSSRRAHEANTLVERMCAILYFAHSQGLSFIIEQPSSSLMNRHPVFQRLLELLGAATCNLEMGAYGAMSRKPTVLWGTAPFLGNLRRTQSAAECRALQLLPQPNIARYFTDSAGIRRVTGGPDLRDTQALLTYDVVTAPRVSLVGATWGCCVYWLVARSPCQSASPRVRLVGSSLSEPAKHKPLTPWERLAKSTHPYNCSVQSAVTMSRHTPSASA